MAASEQKALHIAPQEWLHLSDDQMIMICSNGATRSEFISTRIGISGLCFEGWR